MVVERFNKLILLCLIVVCQVGAANPINVKKNTSNIGADLVEVKKIIPDICLDIRYATKNNFSGKTVYQSARCFLQREVVTALAKVQKELSAMGFGLKIFDGYRPLSVQKKNWDAVADIFPDESERALYVANPKIGSKHNRGAAVDITLIDLATGKEFEMPSGYDEFSEKAYRDYSKMTINSRKNCKLLELIMKKYGFDGVYSEWWHFDFNGWEKYPIFDVTFNDLEKKK